MPRRSTHHPRRMSHSRSRAPTRQRLPTLVTVGCLLLVVVMGAEYWSVAGVVCVRAQADPTPMLTWVGDPRTDSVTRLTTDGISPLPVVPSAPLAACATPHTRAAASTRVPGPALYVVTTTQGRTVFVQWW